MTAILVEPSFSDQQRRAAIYGGDTVHYLSRPHAKAFTDFAWQVIKEAFGSLDPAQAQFELSVERFVEVIAPLKTRFTHHPEAKQLLRALLEERGCDLDQTYFDLPKLRIVTHGGYLTSGVGYAYKAHRDTWYACPPAQINWWTPITEITERCGFVIHPRSFARAVPNNSKDFDAYKWNAEGRLTAAKHISSDPRPHPSLQAAMDLDWQVIVGAPGSMIMFSAQHLHATVPNDAGRTRFSIDFRTVHADDIANKRGAKLIDAECTGTTLRDFLRASDFAHFSDEVIRGYDTSGASDGVLLFDPNALGAK
jgi:hypothetical protein